VKTNRAGGAYNIYYILSVVLASVFLNVDLFHFEPLALWAKLLPPALMLCGIIWSAKQIRILRFIGWIGIALFFIVALAVSFPEEDYVLGHYTGGPPEVSTFQILVRLLVALVMTSFLAMTYKRRPQVQRLRVE
jgi:hypothetical protein